jgi:hypothetical protein
MIHALEVLGNVVEYIWGLRKDSCRNELEMWFKG